MYDDSFKKMRGECLELGYNRNKRLIKDDCLSLAIMHDLIEDTRYTGSGLSEYFCKALKLLTKPKEKDYIDYIKDIHDTGYTNWRMCAWWVKLADMKDHLAQTETLTDKLRDKYLKALPYLL